MNARFSSEAFSDEWVAEMIAAHAERPAVPGLSGVVGLGVGKKVAVVVSITDGRITGSVDLSGAGDDVEPGVTIPFSGAQVEAWQSGELDLSEAYMMGDLKPVGSTGALLAAFTALG